MIYSNGMFNTDTFLRTLVSTNKSHDFFTDWGKARSYQQLYKDELALLGVLTNSSDPREELARLIKTYPRINTLIPLLNAVRIKEAAKTLIVLDENATDDIQYYFGETSLDDATVMRSVDFAEKSGLLAELTKIKNHTDYYFGVEVGMDTNGRKNRSGTAMENITEPYVRVFAEAHDGKYLTQTNFEAAAEKFGVKVPPNQFNKRGDFMILIDGSPINIETNFFDGSGSKQEIMNSYVSRAQDLAKAGWGFGLVTDGLGWRRSRTQLDYGYSTIKYIMNLSMCAEGSLEDMYKELLNR